LIIFKGKKNEYRVVPQDVEVISKQDEFSVIFIILFGNLP